MSILRQLCRHLLVASCGVLSLAVHAATLSLATSTNGRDVPLQAGGKVVLPLAKADYTMTVTDINGHCQQQPITRVKFNHPLALRCLPATGIKLAIRFAGQYSFAYDAQQQTLQIKREPTTTAATTFKRPLPQVNCQHYSGGPVTIDVQGAYPDGTQLTEVFSQQQVTVHHQQLTLTPAAAGDGLLLFERSAPQPHSFTWRNANIYFVMLDRFANGNPNNDHSYGRHGDGKQEIGTFHGGDLAGLISKLDYIKSLGTDAIWLSPLVEQVHGFVGGGSKGHFPFYAYHGYWARDFTKLDANWGTEAELQTLVNQAHQRGIKVLLDVVLNHPGYATLADLQADHIPVLTAQAPADADHWQPAAGANWHSYNQFINYQSPNWSQWWGGDWVRAGLPGYPTPGSSDQTQSVAGLPDFRTESAKPVSPPQWLRDNPGTRVHAQPDFTVADYLIEWQSDWVKRFGIDGFRVDTVKHVDGDVWQRLKTAASQKLQQWRHTHHSATTTPFWMLGEVWNMRAYHSPDYDNGFDALLNFDMQHKMDKGAACLSTMQPVYQGYAQRMQQQSQLNPVSYMSSHDTELFFNRFNSFAMQRGAARALLLSPGAVQVFYGDEVARQSGPYDDDFQQGTRSDMPWQWSAQQQALLTYWRTLGQFRHRHPAIGAGVHRQLPQAGAYVFTRQWQNDKVLVAFVGNSQQP